jgi:hypothetical protein
MAKIETEPFPAINLMVERERIQSGHRPLVRVPFWLALVASTALLIVIMGIQLVPSLVSK